MYRVTVDEKLGGKKWVPVPDESSCTALIDREPSAPLKTFQSAHITNERRQCTHKSKPVMLAANSPCIRFNGSRSIEVLSNIYIATSLGLGWALNIASCWVPSDAKSRSNDSMGVDGGSQRKEKYRNNE